MYIGQTLSLGAVVLAGNGDRRSDKVTWLSDRAAVIAVDADGRLSARSAGRATVSARAGAAVRSFAVTVVDPELSPHARLASAEVVSDLAAVPLTPRTAIVVATHGRLDEDALEAALRSGAAYVSLVASPTRARAVREALRARGVPETRLGELKAPAGLDLGAVTPEEIAVSILAEIVERRRRAPAVAAPAPPATALDPVCGMAVTVATARHTSVGPAGPLYFCCGGCKERYDREPERYPVGAA